MRATQNMEQCFFRISLHMTLAEPQRGEDPKTEKYVSITDMSPLGQINKSKIMAYGEIFERLTVGI